MGKLAVLGLVTLLPLAYWTPFHDCFPLSKWLILLTLGMVAVALGRPFSWSPAFRWFPLWAVWTAVSACWGAAAGSPWRAWPEVALLMLPVWVAASGGHGVDARRAAGLLVAVSSLIAAFGLVQATGWELGTWISPFHKGVASTIGNPDLLGGFLILPFALALAALITRSSVIRIVAVAVLGGALLATEARAAWLAAVAAGVVLLTHAPRRIVKLAGGAVVGAVALLYMANPASLDNLLSPSALKERVWTWKIAARAVRKAPLAGWGAGSFRTVYLEHQTRARDRGEEFFHYTEYAHLEALHFLTELGMIGLGLWLWGLAAAFVLWRTSGLRTHDPALWRGLGAGGLGVLMNSLLSFPFHIPPTVVPLWLLLGLSSGVVSTTRHPRLKTRNVLVRLAVVAVLLAIPFRLAYVSAALRDGQALARAGRHRDAGVRYEAGMKLAAGDVRLPWYAAVAARQRGTLESALQWVERSLVLEPGLYELRYLHGMILKAMGHALKAEAAYREALRIHPGHALAWNNLGNLLGQRGALEEAEAAQRRALTLNPALNEARQNLAVTLMLLNRSDEARGILEGRDEY